ncbi:hypothetical protein M5K25_021534 [Dendrobium thyrsiflorum]|uniref:CCHC-type domain-containing protein n=1 Tax=Dendrobium thyrsiflorum TaxID=117978 RepID=A0ABD0UJL4_DENTH
MDKVPFTDEDGISLIPATEALEDNVAKLERALVAQFVGRRVPFAFLQTELRRQWARFGDFQLITTAPSAFICIFTSAAARDAVLQGGSWLVGGSLLGMVKWTSDYIPNSLARLHSSVWVRLPQLPLLYWDVTNLNRIANFIGEPLWLDSHTSAWGRSSFARMCVRLDLSKPLLPGIWIKGLHDRFFQRIEYEGLSNFCFACGIIGHTVDRCPSEWVNPPASSPDPSSVQIPSAFMATGPSTRISPNRPASPPRPLHLEAPPIGSGPPATAEMGEWNIVKRKKRPKKKAAPLAPVSAPVPSPSGIILKAKGPAAPSSPTASNLPLSKKKKKPQSRGLIPQKEVVQLGSITALPRKRKKGPDDSSGGDVIPLPND